MATSHYQNPHHHHNLPPPPPTFASCCFCADCIPTSCCNPPLQSTLPAGPSLDPLVDCLIARLLQSPPPPPPPPVLGHRLRRRHLNSGDHHHFHQQQSSLLSSLLYRIEALESSLHSLSISSSPPLRDAAAQVIQAHFRSFLARRSRTLRHLKDLAAIKSSFLALKSSASNIRNAHLNLVAVSEKAMNLLLQLDDIQNIDPMIRDGKRSISRDLDAFLEYLDQLAVKRHELLIEKSRKTVQVAANRSNKSKILREQKELVDKLKDRVERIRGLSRVLGIKEEEDVELEGFQNFSDDGEEKDTRLVHRIGLQVAGSRTPRVKKRVSFADNRNVCQVISSHPDHSSSGDDDTESRDNLVKVFAEDGKPKGSYVVVKDCEEAVVEDSSSSDGGDPPRSSQLRDEVEFAFSAPLPERMELGEDLAKKRKGAILTMGG
ncbi:hypothetical protein SAY86_005601 [Trapa natans]|uniref:BAG domain-containing protein n=1 Tax=Trapa natans TaxID=22666 RepID=A0AAN7QVM1_TRANT|nr:hypothetical protein SAY86_005601 [Trapa natans]